jgi:hypothetical protein
MYAAATLYYEMVGGVLKVVASSVSNTTDAYIVLSIG